MGGYCNCDFYQKEKIQSDPDRDIVRIFKIKTATTFNHIFCDDKLELVWERKVIKRMTTEEMRQKLEELTGEKIEVVPSDDE